MPIRQNLFGLVQQLPANVPALPSQFAVEGRAVICYDTILNDYDAVITGSNDAVGFPASNIANGLTYSYWTPATGGVNTITFFSTYGKPVDYIGVAKHSLFSTGSSVDFQYSDDGGVTWTSLIAGGYAPGSDAPFALRFTQVLKRAYRLVVNSPSNQTPRIAVVQIGAQFPLQRGIFVGHAPATYNRDIKYQTNESEGGNFLGRSLLRRANVTSFQMSRMTPDWYRNYFYPFQLKAETNPFFFLWNVKRTMYQSEIIFGYMTEPPTPTHTHQSFMTVSMSIRGLA